MKGKAFCQIEGISFRNYCVESLLMLSAEGAI